MKRTKRKNICNSLGISDEITGGSSHVALMYYGKRDEHGIEKSHQRNWESSCQFCHFEREMEKNIELANGIGLGCRETILAEMKVLEK